MRRPIVLAGRFGWLAGRLWLARLVCRFAGRPARDVRRALTCLRAAPICGPALWCKS